MAGDAAGRFKQRGIPAFFSLSFAHTAAFLECGPIAFAVPLDAGDTARSGGDVDRLFSRTAAVHRLLAVWGAVATDLEDRLTLTAAICSARDAWFCIREAGGGTFPLQRGVSAHRFAARLTGSVVVAFGVAAVVVLVVGAICFHMPQQSDIDQVF